MTILWQRIVVPWVAGPRPHRGRRSAIRFWIALDAGHAVAVQDQADVLVIGLPASVSGRLLVCC